MKLRLTIGVTLACVLAFVLGAWTHQKRGATVTHEPIDTHTLARFLNCYAHNITISKDALAKYTKYELQIVHADGTIHVISSNVGAMHLNKDGTFSVVFLVKPSDPTKTIHNAPKLDSYFNGMVSGFKNPFFGVMENGGFGFVRDNQLHDDALLLFEYSARHADGKLVEASIRLQFS